MTTAPSPAPFGSWRSPLTAAVLTAGTVDLSEPQIDGPDLYWLESRPADAGRVVVVRRTSGGEQHEVTGAPYNVRSRVHEYGGGAYDVDGRVLAFANFSDMRIYQLDLREPDAEPRPITPAGPLRYGDLRLDTSRGLLFAVCEDHTGDGEPANRLVRLRLDDDNVDGGASLVADHDFVSSPTLSPDGRRLAWVQWDHPNMPWDGSELCVGELSDDGSLSRVSRVAGGATESVGQPQWSPDGRLVFLSDRTGWWNLYAANPDRDSPDVGSREPTALWPASYDFGDPLWGLGMSSYAISASGTLLASWLVDGYSRLGVLDLLSGTCAELASEAAAVTGVRVEGEIALFLAGYDDLPPAVVTLDLGGARQATVVRRSTADLPDPDMVSVAEPVTWRGSGHDEVFGFYYPPHNAYFVGLEGELPPLLVLSHGGPTGMSRPVYFPALQLWTSRGYAVLQVNYGGSSGYGRAYRERLRGAWGIVDVDDCVSGAQAMAAAGKADPRRLAIRGGSAGGYTTLAALTFRDVFAAGASHFGVADLEALARETHKFESRYLDGLVGPLPEARDVYVARSPIHHVDQISCPVILLQGTDDLVVPRNQAETMADAVRARGLPVALVLFEGEGHGFRKAENLIRSFEAEEYFYSKVFGFQLADEVEPVPIDNLSAS